MIIGIGTDLANIERIAGVLERHGDRFRHRVSTETEQRKAERRHDVAGTYAKRWAERSLLQSFGDWFAHGHQLERYGCAKFAHRPADYAGHWMGKDPS